MRHKTGRLFVPFITELKAIGFTQEYDSHGGGCRTLMFTRECPNIKRYIWVELSAWPTTAMCRLGRGGLNRYGRASSIEFHGLPVEFFTVREMLHKIIEQLGA